MSKLWKWFVWWAIFHSTFQLFVISSLCFKIPFFSQLKGLLHSSRREEPHPGIFFTADAGHCLHWRSSEKCHRHSGLWRKHVPCGWIWNGRLDGHFVLILHSYFHPSSWSSVVIPLRLAYSLRDATLASRHVLLLCSEACVTLTKVSLSFSPTTPWEFWHLSRVLYYTINSLMMKESNYKHYKCIV